MSDDRAKALSAMQTVITTRPATWTTGDLVDAMVDSGAFVAASQIQGAVGALRTIAGLPDRTAGSPTTLDEAREIAADAIAAAGEQSAEPEGAVYALLKIAVEGPSTDMRGVALNELQRLGVDLDTYEGSARPLPRQELTKEDHHG